MMLSSIAITLLVALTAFTQVAQAAPRGTPTVVTNDATSPVAVTGTISVSNSTLYKPIGITQQNLSFNPLEESYYAMSVACSLEFNSSRICTSEELLKFPNRVTVGSVGSWIMPTIVGVAPGSGYNGVFDISGKKVLYYGAPSYNSLVFKNNDIALTQHTSALTMPVVCCAP